MRASHRYLIVGILFGCCFPLSATLADLWFRQLAFNWSNLIFVQVSQPLHWMIDTAPLFLGLFAWVGGLRAEQAERTNARLQARSEELAAALARAEQADELARLNEENTRLYAETRAQLEAFTTLDRAYHQSQAIIQQLDLPLIPVQHGVVVAPLIGALDQARMERLSSPILRYVAQHTIGDLIVDCTAITLIDAEAATELSRCTAALRLLGCRVHLSGLSPETAQALVTQNLPVIGATHSDLASALARLRSSRAD